jgi:CheY-like chemotaxis protein
MPKATILIIDDNETNLKLLNIILTKEGYVVTTAPDAEQALLILQSLIPDLILTDLQLPGMDGFELTRRIKNNPITSATPVIAITAFAMKGDREKVLAAGCDDYVAKPIDTRGLPALIEKMLAEKRSA